MKRKLTRLLSMVCTIAMVLSLVPVLPVAAATDVFYDNMENYTVGTDLYTQAGDKYTKTSPAWGNSSFTAASQGNVAVVADPTNSSNKVLAVTAAGQSKRFVLTPAPKVTGDYTLQFDYMPAKAVSNVGSGFLDVYINDGRNQVARINYRTYGSYFYLDGASASGMIKNTEINKDNTWYSVRVVVSEDEYTMDIWEKGAKDATLLTTTATKGQKANAGTNVEFCFGPYDSAWGMDTSSPITNYIDNIRITPGVVEAADAAKDDGAVTVVGGGMVTFADAAKIVNTEEVAITAGMGLFAGTPEGNFDPTGNVTRAQMATIIVKMLRGNAFNADNFKGFNKFSDTADYQGGWAEGYINACVQMGIVSGYGDGTFKPDKAVTTAEALTMIINALKVDAGEGSWPDTIMTKAASMKLYGNLATKPGTYDALTRDQLAVLTYEGMCYSPSGVTGYRVADPDVEIVFDNIADAMKANGGVIGITEVVGEDTLATKIYGLKVAEGYITSNQATSDDEFTTITPVAEDGVKVPYQFNMETELDEIGHYVTVYYREAYKSENEPGVVYNYVDETQVVTVKEDIETSNAYKEAFGKSVKLAKKVARFTNAYEWGEYAVGTGDTYDAGNTAAKGNYFINEGEIVGYMPLVPVVAAKVRAVNKFDGNETIELSSVDLPISNSEDNDRIVEYAKIAKDDYVTYIVVGSGANATYVLSKATTTKGTVEKTFVNDDNKNVITMKGVDYVQFDGTNNIADFKNLAKVTYTDSYTLYVTEDGEYLGYEKTAGGLNLDETVFILGELTVVTNDGFGGKIRKTTARGIDMKGNEVNLLLKVEKNGTVDVNGNFFPSREEKDNVAAPSYAAVKANTFYSFELSNDKDAKKENIYVLTPYATSYDKNDVSKHIYSGTRDISDGGAFAFSNFSCNGKTTYYHGATTYILLEGDVYQSTPLSATVKKSWATSTNTTGATMHHYYLFSRNESDAQMLDVAVVVADNALAAAGTQVYYVSEANRTPIGTNAEGYVFTVYDYKTGAKKELTVKTDDRVLVDGKIPTAGYWHTLPEADTNRHTLVEKVVDTGAFSGTTSNSSTNDKLYTENIAHDQQLLELMDDELNTTAGSRLRKASGAVVVDVRTEEDIVAAGIGKITSADRLGTLAIDHPEITVIFDLCYSSTSSKMLTLFVKDVYFTSVGGANITKSGDTYYLDGRVVNMASLTVADASGRLQADPTKVGDVMTELVDAIAGGKTVNVSYTMKNGKVNGLTVTAILNSNELFVETFQGFKEGSLGQAVPSSMESVWLTESGTNEFIVEDEDGDHVLKSINEIDTKRRVWFKPAGVFSGNYTFAAEIKIGESNSTYDLRWRNIDIAGGTDDFTLRINSAGELYQVYGSSKISSVKLTRNEWYKVVVTVDETNGKVKTEIYDKAGELLTSGEEACGDFAAYETVGPTIDFNGGGIYYIDDITITRGAAIVEKKAHNITVKDTDPNGILSANVTSAKEGETVTFTTTAKAGYKLNTLVVADKDGKNGVNILANNDDLSTTIETAYTMPNEDITVTATFVEQKSFKLSVEQADANGTVTVDKDGVLPEGEIITITATPKDSSTHILDSIMINGEAKSTTSPFAYTMVDEDAKVTAAFRPYNWYTVEAGAVLNGTLAMAGEHAGTGTWREGDTITVTATPAAGWELNTLYVNGEAIEGNTFTLKANSTVTALFWPEGAMFYEGFDFYTVGAELGDAFDKSFSAHMSQGTVEKAIVDDGSNALKITVAPGGDNTGRYWIKPLNAETGKEAFTGNFMTEVRFKHGGTGDGLTGLRMTGVTLPGASEGYGHEMRIYTGGDIYFWHNAGIDAANKIGSENKSLYLYDKDGKKITQSADTWYVLKAFVNKDGKTLTTELWNGDGTTLLGSRTFTGITVADAGTNVGFDLQKGSNGSDRYIVYDYYTVKALPESDVTVATTPDGCTVTADKASAVKVGEVVTLTANYDADKYVLTGITVNGVAATKVNDTTYTFTMPAEDAAVTATFKAVYYGYVTATVNDSALGSIVISAPANGTTYKEGETVTVTVTAATNNYVESITPQLTKVSEENGVFVYTLTMGTADVAIHAVLATTPTYTVSAGACENGSVSVDTDSALRGTTINVTATPNTGWELKTIYVNDTAISGTSFALEANSTVTAEFWPEGAIFFDGFGSYGVGADLPLGSGKNFIHHLKQGTYSNKIVNDNGTVALELSATDDLTAGDAKAGRTWPKTTALFKDEFTVETRIKYVSASGGVTVVRMTELDVPNASGMGDFELRFKTDGYVYVNRVTAENALHGETVGSTTSLYLYNNNGAKVVTTGGVWYTAKIHVKGSTVVVELYDDNGYLGGRTVYGAVLAEAGTAVGFDHQSHNAGTNNVRKAFVDYLAVKDYEYETPVFDVTVATTPDGCTVTADKTTDVEAGETVTLTANYDAELYVLTGITVNGVAATKVNDTTYTFTMPGTDATVTATFEEIFYGTVNTTFDATVGNVTVSAHANNRGYQKDEEVTITVSVNDADTSVQSVTMNGQPLEAVTEGTYKFTMPEENVTVAVTFKQAFYGTVTATYDPALGNVTVSAPDKENLYKEGNTVTVTVSVNNTDDYYVSGVTMNGEAATKVNDTTYTFTMPGENVTVAATIASIPTYGVTVGTFTGGSVAADKTAGIKAGETVTLTVTAETDYTLSGLPTVSAGETSVTVTKTQGKENEYTFTMPEGNVTVSATFLYDGIQMDEKFGDAAAMEQFATNAVPDGGTATATVESENLKLYIKNANAINKTPSLSVATDAMNIAKLTMKVHVTTEGAALDYFAVKLSDLGLELRFENDGVVGLYQNGTLVGAAGTYTKETWCEIDVTVTGGNATVKVGGTQVGNAVAVSGTDSTLELAIVHVKTKAATKSKSTTVLIDDIYVAS